MKSQHTTVDGWREARVLQEIEADPRVSQRDISKRLGIALGLTNSILKRLARKGLVRIRALKANQLAYYITPKGFQEKARLVAKYVRRTASFFFPRFSCTRAAQ